jgi:hypothetical protein
MTRIPPSIIKRNTTRAVTMILAAAALASAMPALAQSKLETACPVKFFSLSTIWYNNASKEIVTVASGSAVADRQGWTLADLCQHDETGDVQIFDRKPLGGRSAAVR